MRKTHFSIKKISIKKIIKYIIIAVCAFVSLIFIILIFFVHFIGYDTVSLFDYQPINYFNDSIKTKIKIQRIYKDHSDDFILIYDYDKKFSLIVFSFNVRVINPKIKFDRLLKIVQDDNLDFYSNLPNPNIYNVIQIKSRIPKSNQLTVYGDNESEIKNQISDNLINIKTFDLALSFDDKSKDVLILSTYRVNDFQIMTKQIGNDFCMFVLTSKTGHINDDSLIERIIK